VFEQAQDGEAVFAARAARRGVELVAEVDAHERGDLLLADGRAAAPRALPAAAVLVEAVARGEEQVARDERARAPTRPADIARRVARPAEARAEVADPPELPDGRREVVDELAAHAERAVVQLDVLRGRRPFATRLAREQRDLGFEQFEAEPEPFVAADHLADGRR
jgi:hypothetical protein